MPSPRVVATSARVSGSGRATASWERYRLARSPMPGMLAEQPPDGHPAEDPAGKRQVAGADLGGRRGAGPGPDPGRVDDVDQDEQPGQAGQQLWPAAMAGSGHHP